MPVFSFSRPDKNEKDKVIKLETKATYNDEEKEEIQEM
jgi:hypothetical protein